MKLSRCLLVLGVTGLLSLSGTVMAVNENFEKGMALYQSADRLSAIPYFELAAAENVIEAQRLLGYMLWKGGDSTEEALGWILSATEAGDLEAKGFLLSLLTENLGQSYVRSADVKGWLEKNADEDVLVKMRLAQVLEGDDDARALVLYNELAESGFRDAIIRLIHAYQREELGLSANEEKVAALVSRLK